MQLERIEAKFKAKYRVANPRTPGSGGFILSDGAVVPTTNHASACDNIGCKLDAVLEVGLCRYMFRVGQQGNVAAFEYHTLTPEQKNAIRGMLKADDYFTVVTEKTTIDRQRPIRSLTF